MANEAEIVEYLGNDGDVMNMTVANGDAFSKGALMVFRSDTTRTISGSSATTVQVATAGIASSEKEASDGATTLGVITNCVARLSVVSPGGVVQAGQAVCISGANQIDGIKGDGADSGIYLCSGAVLGRALEEGTAGARVQVRVLI